ncbi:UDP-N-acetylmuramoyl-L-alanyl-D-glutamate--2,6-diaminopimelate ligase [Solicola gregarius]|uniref:UDP-N-acetylmuramoyl-L-alanyl-D-glutamate--2,6-diaminopimelate ligase n=1 Tax=Solicola gregarius TaxID=2908642 RepID=A0AA46THP5_9ACTN|nr:UDP-N-acetylmuramoyl-L-alanyl-D-glutamate--2,6-diaminopimelate ligase [Solicola gregarius]UYM05358.1 UDP-N-acetylmuramoyl-L-alanyl-D-glutamate--2,6-diaminopimelate ligase [Solicola gregarius]
MTSESRDVTGAARPRYVEPVSLSAVCEALGIPAATGQVTGVSLASTAVEPGDLYAALPGARTHGARYAADAVEAGAVAVLTDPDGARIISETRVPVLVVDGPRAVLGDVAALVYDRPAAAMLTVGVTGTQGKTTVTQLAESALDAAGQTPAVVGTIGTRIAGQAVRTALTTPEAPALHALFAAMKEQGVTACAMEVSSHALVQGRVDGIVFDVAVFLNLGRDHLDFHGTVEDYFTAKATLFTERRARRAVVNVGDPFGTRLADSTVLPVTTFSTTGAADWSVVRTDAGASGTSATFAGPDGELDVEIPMPGAFNVENALAVVAALAAGGIDPRAAARGIAASPGVPGRMQRVDAGQDFQVVVDYAHKPDALEAVLATLRPVTSGRLIVVVGAGGDRDTGKRPVMGEIAARLADVVVVTDDNPRSEDAAEIRRAVLAGAEAAGTDADVRETGDRGAAISQAVSLARAGDCVLIAGKGHEQGQEVAGTVHPFDDVLQARAALQALDGAGTR